MGTHRFSARSMRRGARFVATGVLGVVGLWSFSGNGLAQVSPAAPTEQAVDTAAVPTEQITSTEPMEEVVVRGRRSVMQLRNEAGRKTREFYNLLNRFLDEPDYQIRCFRGRPPQGGAVQQVCRAAYQERAARRLVDNVALASASSEDVPVYELMMLYDPSLEMMERTAEFTSAILTAVNTHPELNRAARELIELKREIVAAEQAPRRERRERRRND